MESFTILLLSLLIISSVFGSQLQDLLGQCPELRADRWRNHGDPMKSVDIALYVDVFYGIDTISETVSIHGELSFNWTVQCENLSKLANFTVASFDPGQNLWRPMIKQLFSKSDAYLIEGFSSLIVIQQKDPTDFSNIDVAISVAGTFQSQCKIELADYPFDDQYCDVMFTSLLSNSFTFRQVALLDFSAKQSANNATKLDFSRVVSSNSEWVIRSSQVETITETWANNSTVSFVVFKFHTKRRPEYFLYYWLIPCFILSLLTLSTFLLPVDDSQRPMFSVSVLLSLMVLLSQVVERIPETPQNIFITQYITIDMSFTLVVTLYVAMACRIKVRRNVSSRKSIDSKKPIYVVGRLQWYQIIDVIAFILAAAFCASLHIWVTVLALNALEAIA